MDTLSSFISENRQRFINELFEFIKIPSISAKPEHTQDMYVAAEFIKQHLEKIGIDKAVVNKTNGHPIVYAEKIIDPKLPTILIYGHYDVQPVEPLEEWISEPFKPEIRDEKIFARGADDDKGQLFMHLKAYEFLVQKKMLPCNVKFMIEGEEEVGSENLGSFCQQNKDLLKSDVILISDTGMISMDVPSITVGLRGLSYMEVEIIGPNRDLHSGLYGGAVANPANILCDMISSLKNKENKITIPGFYDDVIELSENERAEMAKNPFNLENYIRALNIEDVYGEKLYSTIERTGIRPTLDINGIWSGYIEPGAKTIIPSKAFAKISMRLVPNQNDQKIADLFTKYFKSLAPKGITVNVTYLHGGSAYVSPIDSHAYLSASNAIEKVFGKKPIPTRSGGSIPIVALFEELLGVKSILMGFGQESDAIHSPNENFPLKNFFKGIETIPHFYQNFAKGYNQLNKNIV